MQAFLYVLLLLFGFVLLIKGADWFVDGAAALAKKLKVPGVIIGLTVVAMGTSAPELAVSVTSAISHSNGLCLGNVIGSNLFNLLVVLGACAVISPIAVEKGILTRDFPFSLVTTMLVAVFAGLGFIFSGNIKNADMTTQTGTLTRTNGIILLVFFALYLVVTVIVAIKNREEGEDIESLPLWKSLLYLGVGIACIVIGGNLVVDNAKQIAYLLGMSETLVGLTIVAIGTSLPELVTSVVASRKGQNGMAVGNVVGSNIFNLLLIIGVSCVINPIGIAFESIIDMVCLLVASVMSYIFCITGKKVCRSEGAVMVVCYVAYTGYAIARAMF